MTTGFLVRKSVPLPPRVVPNPGPRQTKYPIDDMEPGDAFALPVDSEKQGRQRQSQFSSLARSRGIKLSTRVFLEDNEVTAALGVPAPCVGIWHMGAADTDEGNEEAEANEELEL